MKKSPNKVLVRAQTALRFVWHSLVVRRCKIVTASGMLCVMKFRGTIQNGVKDFAARMKNYPDVFDNATGEKLFPGTLNVRLARKVPIKEEFRIVGADIGEPNQDLLFERCRINGKNAYRIRPLNLKTGRGGHGDHIIEIACSEYLKGSGLKDGDTVEIEFFR
jgi:CTP-dependent riboflavin kinase